MKVQLSDKIISFIRSLYLFNHRELLIGKIISLYLPACVRFLKTTKIYLQSVDVGKKKDKWSKYDLYLWRE